MTIHFSVLANHQVRHQATHNVGCQPGDCRGPVNLPQGFVWTCIMYELTYSLYHTCGRAPKKVPWGYMFCSWSRCHGFEQVRITWGAVFFCLSQWNQKHLYKKWFLLSHRCTWYLPSSWILGIGQSRQVHTSGVTRIRVVMTFLLPVYKPYQINLHRFSFTFFYSKWFLLSHICWIVICMPFRQLQLRPSLVHQLSEIS